MLMLRRHPLVIVAALAALAGCGQREPARVVETPPPTNEKPMPEHEPPAVALAVEEPAISSTMMSIPVVVQLDDRPEGYWSSAADTIANAGTAPAAQAAAPAPAARSGAEPAKTWPTIDAGELILPQAVNPGRVDDVGDGRELWLMTLPMTFKAKNGFDKPLKRIDLLMILGDAVAQAEPASPGSGAAPRNQVKSEKLGGDWSLTPIKDVGYEGLRHGPNPMPDGPFQYWFRSDQLIPALMRDDGRQRGGWRLRHPDWSSLPAGSEWYAIVAAPRGARHAVATVQAKLWFTRRDEATVTLPAVRIGIDLHPPKPGKGVSAQSAVAPAPAEAQPAEEQPAEAQPADAQPEAEQPAAK